MYNFYAIKITENSSLLLESMSLYRKPVKSKALNLISDKMIILGQHTMSLTSVNM